MSEHDDHEHDRGLSHDLPTLLHRRRALGLFGGAGLIATLAACGADPSDSTSAGTTVADGEIPDRHLASIEHLL